MFPFFLLFLWGSDLLRAPEMLLIRMCLLISQMPRTLSPHLDSEFANFFLQTECSKLEGTGGNV